MISFDKIYNNSAGTLRWLRMEEGRPFIEAMKEHLADANRKLVKETDLAEVWRLQGEVRVFERFANMDSELVELHRKRSSGVLPMPARAAKEGGS